MSLPPNHDKQKEKPDPVSARGAAARPSASGAAVLHLERPNDLNTDAMMKRKRSVVEGTQSVAPSRPSSASVAAPRPPPSRPSASASVAAPRPPPSRPSASASGAAVLYLERPKEFDADVMKRKRSVVEGTGPALGPALSPVVALVPPKIVNFGFDPVFGPDTLETAMEKKERAQITARKDLNKKRVVEACAPFRLEYDGIERREISLNDDIKKLDRHLSDLATESRRFSFYPENHVKKQDIAQLQHLYMLERLQMGEEIMRIRDRMAELRNIIRNIYRQYEIQPDPSDEIMRHRHGGTQKQKQKQKRSLKCKRSKRRKNATKKR
jgi:hypothetical protein